jgi:hypothetical protein
MHPQHSWGVRGERRMLDLVPTHWCMQVNVFVEVATFDIPMPLTVVLDGGAAVFPTSMAVDFLP